MAIGGTIVMSKRTATLLINKEIAHKIYLMRLKMHHEGIAAKVKVGQFVNIAIPNDQSMILRRPISINNVNTQENTIDLVYQVVGGGTERLSQLKEGDKIDSLGPLGKGFDLALAKTHAIVIGGGVGVAPLLMLCEALKQNDVKVDSFLGFRSAALAYQQADFEALCSRVAIATEDGTLGHLGYVTTLVEEAINTDKPDIIYACGPTPLLKVVQKIAMSHHIPCELSLEERMGCGIGSCLVCACEIKTKDGSTYKKVCKDGPVFKASEVLFNE